MSQSVQYFVNRTAFTARPTATVEAFSDGAVAAVRPFQTALAGYAPTPLLHLDALAGCLGLAGLSVKDESRRFGLNAFKVLGASYAVGCLAARRLGLPLAAVAAAGRPAGLDGLVLATATDGNHGRAVAWAARQMGLGCVVRMPKGSSPSRLANIRAEGAVADILEMNYDQAVAATAAEAAAHGWELVQDTAWDGYEETPLRIMQGYTTMVEEVRDQLAQAVRPAPTHVFLQAGVGSLAGAILGRLVARQGSVRPRVVVVEAAAADCLFRSARHGKGGPVTVAGDLATIMAGLACGQPSATAWPILRDYANAFVSCPDQLAARGMRILGNPLGRDPAVVSGESGAVTLGLVAQIMTDPALAALRQALDLGPASRVLLFSTEGDTDPARYRDIVWDGLLPAA